MNITFKPYKEWGMYTPQGDKSLEKKAQLLINKINKANTIHEICYAIGLFVKSYRRMSKTKTLAEASDTEVRNVVFSFLEKVCKDVGIDSYHLESIWDMYY
jgi:uncharacterized lipoprotein YajG